MRPMKDLVSVIVPIYNAEKYIDKCLASISQQTYRALEIILIDDGSSDKSAAICDCFAKKYRNIIAHYKKNEGLINARKDGFHLANGEWILFVDSDDWIASNMIEVLLQYAQKYNADVVTSGVILSMGADLIKKYDSAEEGVYEGAKLKNLKENLLGMLEDNLFCVLPYLWNKLWNRRVLEDSLNSADTTITIGEDVTIGFPALVQAQSIYVTKEAFYYYRQDNCSMMRAKKDEAYEIKNAGRMYRHLVERFELAGQKFLAESGAKELYINQLLTRGYLKVNEWMRCDGCFPFVDRLDAPIIVYGAGAFGRAVYEYLAFKGEVKAWIDANAEALQRIGYPVVAYDPSIITDNDIIIVPIMDNKVSKQIYRSLKKDGVRDGQIKLFHLANEDKEYLLEIS